MVGISRTQPGLSYFSLNTLYNYPFYRFCLAWERESGPCEEAINTLFKTRMWYATFLVGNIFNFFDIFLYIFPAKICTILIFDPSHENHYKKVCKHPKSPKWNIHFIFLFTSISWFHWYFFSPVSHKHLFSLGDWLIRFSCWGRKRRNEENWVWGKILQHIWKSCCKLLWNPPPKYSNF